MTTLIPTHQKGLKDDLLRLGRALEVSAAAAAVVATPVHHCAFRVELAVLLLGVVDVDDLGLRVLALGLDVVLHVGDVVHRLLQFCKPRGKQCLYYWLNLYSLRLFL